MAGHPLQFPKFVIARYPPRWNDFLNTGDRTSSGYDVAVMDTGKIVGHAGYIFNPEVDLYEIVGVVVSKDVQRQGIGKALIQQVCEELLRLGTTKVILYTLGHSGNEATLEFYRQIGFEQVNWEQDFFKTDYHRVTFIKE
ncbi:GNAT family N-acetyltransferase [Marinicrinis lubricantis]|uniref:GNAT family N-acetyltransferase n=1 Tax=Marinicrinis lubricantis TaxID=2086470 RepID=A0ABW1IKH8_9BACL